MPQARSIDDANPLLEALQSGEHGVESLARQVGQSVGHVQEALLRLELVGRVVRLPGQRYARASQLDPWVDLPVDLSRVVSI